MAEIKKGLDMVVENVEKFEVGDKVRWVKQIEDGDIGINKNLTKSWPKLGDIDEVVNSDGKTIYLENFFHSNKYSWAITLELGFVEKIDPNKSVEKVNDSLLESVKRLLRFEFRKS